MEPSEPLNNTLCTIHNVSRGCGGGGGGESGGVMEKKIELGSRGKKKRVGEKRRHSAPVYPPWPLPSLVGAQSRVQSLVACLNVSELQDGRGDGGDSFGENSPSHYPS